MFISHRCVINGVLRVGVIGVGSMGQNHARLYSELADLKGIYDLDESKAGEIADRFNTEVYYELDRLLHDVDAVSVCTPTAKHSEVASEAIDAGVSVLVEKPFTGDSEKAKELCQRAEDRGVTLASGFVERFNPVVTAARESVKNNRFGDVISMASRRVSSFPSRIRDVGVISDLAIHDIDVMRHITNSEVEAVYAVGGAHSHDKFEDYVNILMEMKGGVVSFLEANWLTPMKVRKVSMTCNEGFVQLDYIDQELEICSTEFREIDSADMFHLPLEEDVRKISVRKEEPLKRELEDFLHAVEEGSRPSSDGWGAVVDLRICEAAKASMRQKKRVEIKRR